MGDNRPIGVFDSGVGGLTVLTELHRALPEESLLYLGDTARVPYGSKSRATVLRYSMNNLAFLNARGVKMIVVACNTASAYAMEELEKRFPRTIGVITGGVEAAVAAAARGEIGVIGTEATVNSGSYEKAIRERRPGAKVKSLACPLFVPLAEEGWTENSVARAVAEEYLAPLKGKVDTLVLGCTHYPLLKKTIGEVLGPSVTLIDSAEQTARLVRERLDSEGMRAAPGSRGKIAICVTDSPERSLAVARRMLGGVEMDSVELVDIT